MSRDHFLKGLSTAKWKPFLISPIFTVLRLLMNLTSPFKVFIKKLICPMSCLAQPGQFSVQALSQNKSTWKGPVFVFFCWDLLWAVIISQQVNQDTSYKHESWALSCWPRENLLVHTSSLNIQKREETGLEKREKKGGLNSLKLCHASSLAGCKVKPGNLLCLQQVCLLWDKGTLTLSVCLWEVLLQPRDTEG